MQKYALNIEKSIEKFFNYIKEFIIGTAKSLFGNV